mmetsp:Transcript_56030/g.133487  ORF Transcript_56030/g.133487 Transcript_56030/m.133487 type:complete len:233 (-) Transcript_56030:240-938(-)|eukprot:CAMPEP_0178428988 /NCGR_PEP_ID=MMETSP0689_2-20121128/30566_1 /TAXON_ID=160604 /ORGANISM="Amphidinium massartii, Strain CS-259" /LENGTH=232 /DNA_ID=CAMNT_0020050787 /DNA_START=75 /DNA_END=773 /DNA_ORIENTATION=+
MALNVSRRSRVSRTTAICCVASLAGALLVLNSAFVAGTVARPSVSLRGGVRNPSMMAEAEDSSALVKVTEDNIKTTAGVVAGLVGALFGGLWVGAAFFAASSYLVRKDDDVALALRGLSKGALESLNFAANMDGKYKVTGKIGEQVSGAVNSSLKPADKSNLDSAVKSVSDQVSGLDKEVGIKSTLGKFATQAGDLAATAVDKAVEFNSKNKVTDQIAAKVTELTKDKKPKA